MYEDDIGGDPVAGPGSGSSTEDQLPVPEYDAEQYLPTGKRAAARRDLLRREFGYMRTAFKSRRDRYWELQRRLNQARLGTTYDIYLTRLMTYTVLAGIGGAVLGLLLTGTLTSLGVFSSLEAPPSLTTDLGGIASFIGDNRVLFAGAVLSLLLMAVFSVATWLGGYYYPYLVVDGRRRNTEIMLPHAIVYMYALSFGGMDFVQVLRRMAEAEETYGEVALEFEGIVNDIDVFGNDLFTALRNARNLTPSNSLEAFLDDMLSVLDSGGNMTVFLESESEKYIQEAEDEQERFLETLATLSEVFIVGFVAAPLFLIVTLMLLSFLGAETNTALFVVVYGVLPLGMAMFLVVISVVSEPYKQPAHEPDIDRDGGDGRRPDFRDHPGYMAFRRARMRSKVRDFFASPMDAFLAKPLRVLVFSVPAAIVATVLAAGLVGVPLSLQTMLDRPIMATTVYLATPFLVASIPLAAVHDIDRRRKRNIAKRFPDALNLLASANQMGVRLTAGLELVARNMQGTFATELRRVRNDLEWNYDVQTALLGLADRLRVPQLTRTCKIIAEGSRSTSDLYKVLSIATEDTRHRYRLERRRRQEMSSYTAIVILGFLVYLAVIVVIQRSFIGPIVAQDLGGGAGFTAIGGGALDVSVYHAVFFHSALIQAVGTGFITGKLADNSVLSGLKYAIGLTVLAMGVFMFL